MFVELCWWNSVGGMMFVERCLCNGIGGMVLVEKWGKLAFLD